MLIFAQVFLTLGVFAPQAAGEMHSGVLLPNGREFVSWEQSPVDEFILATLQTKKLTPSPRADKVTL
ncbi:MAG: hypothetical protein LAO07_19545, partial [Acidobacteriia bacterium]|nr:hypothetical protein [Terriglobia bacterium]